MFKYIWPVWVLTERERNHNTCAYSVFRLIAARCQLVTITGSHKNVDLRVDKPGVIKEQQAIARYPDMAAASSPPSLVVACSTCVTNCACLRLRQRICKQQLEGGEHRYRKNIPAWQEVCKPTFTPKMFLIVRFEIKWLFTYFVSAPRKETLRRIWSLGGSSLPQCLCRAHARKTRIESDVDMLENFNLGIVIGFARVWHEALT